MYVNRVVGPLVALQASRGSGHRLVVLGADDDDDEILFLRQEKITTGSKLLQLSNFFMQQVHSCRTSWVPRCENDFLCRQITQFKLFSFHLIIMKEFQRQFAFFFFYLTQVSLHEVNLAYASELLLENVDLKQAKLRVRQFNPAQKTHKFFIHFNCVKPVNRTSWQITRNNL